MIGLVLMCCMIFERGGLSSGNQSSVMHPTSKEIEGPYPVF